MSQIAFIGLGNMGAPMAGNLAKAGHDVLGYDAAPAAREAFAASGGALADSLEAAVGTADAVITMLPAGAHVREVVTGEGGVLSHLKDGALLIDCSTIDVAAAREVAAAAGAQGVAMVDAPVSGGVGGAAAATLTFMVGGEEATFARAEPLLAAMGKTVVYCGSAGAGQAAKVCNNMILGISMIAVSEAFNLADGLGLDRQKLFDVASTASGQCWSLTTYCPVPGPVPTSPANRDYAPGFTAQMMLKDLKLAAEAADTSGVATPLGAGARALYEAFCDAGGEATDFSGIITHLRGKD
ncbi:MAG: 3-hydroxyisobutyrate dehydrogenase [Pseudomonadota bacterium]